MIRGVCRLIPGIVVFLLIVAVQIELSGQAGGSGESTARFSELVRDAYGTDQVLLNGRQFVNHYQQCLGHPYFIENRLSKGALTIRGKVYRNLSLNYDLVTQDLELEYTSRKGMNNRIIIIPDFVEHFQYGNYEFRKLDMGDGEMRYYQVVPTDPFTCFVHWYKNLVPVSNNIHYLEECSDARRVYWLEFEGKVSRFRDRKGFVSLFPGIYQREIRKHLGREMFRFRNATPESLVKMMDEISKLVTPGDSS